MPLILLDSPAGPDSTVTTGIAVAAGVCAISASTLWLFRWPTRRQSVIYNTVCGACTAATVLAVSGPYAGLMGAPSSR